MLDERSCKYCGKSIFGKDICNSCESLTLEARETLRRNRRVKFVKGIFTKAKSFWLCVLLAFLVLNILPTTFVQEPDTFRQVWAEGDFDSVSFYEDSRYGEVLVHKITDDNPIEFIYTGTFSLVESSYEVYVIIEGQQYIGQISSIAEDVTFVEIANVTVYMELDYADEKIITEREDELIGAIFGICISGGVLIQIVFWTNNPFRLLSTR